MTSLDEFARLKVAQLAEADLARSVHLQRRVDAVHLDRAGRSFVSFSCNDMLGLAHHPDVVAAAQHAAEFEGAGAGASRLVTGSSTSVTRLEAALSRFRGTERTLVFGSGSLTNLGVMPAVVGQNDLVVLDERAHSSLFSGARLSRATVLTFPHNDAAALRQLLDRRRNAFEHVLVAVEGVYSMDGDIAPLPAIVDACEANAAWLLVDDAHALGVLGEGRGTAAHFGIDPSRLPLYVATLSKALGSYGGLVGCSANVADMFVSRARTLVYTTGLPPPSAAAALAALRIIEEDGGRRNRPLELARRFAQRVGRPPPDAHLVPLVIGDAADAVAAQRALEDKGFLVTAIRPPTVAAKTARLRVSFSAAHRQEDVDGLADAWLSLPASAAAAKKERP